MTESPPAATLWVAQTVDAAVALVLLAPGPLDSQHLWWVMLERRGGPSGTWIGEAAPEAAAGNNCTEADGYCVGIVEHTPAHQITIYGTWRKIGGASGTYMRFAEHLAGPAQGGVLEGTRFYAANSTPADAPTAALVILGTSGQADVDAAATWLATQP